MFCRQVTLSVYLSKPATTYLTLLTALFWIYRARKGTNMSIARALPTVLVLSNLLLYRMSLHWEVVERWSGSCIVTH